MIKTYPGPLLPSFPHPPPQQRKYKEGILFFIPKGFNVGKGSKHNQNREIIVEASRLPGFTMLQWLLRQHTDVPEVYLMMLALTLGKSVNDIPPNFEVCT